jgi:protein-tyrosine phosphatase
MLDIVSRAGLDDQITIDSAGTAAHHVGEPADRRSRSTAAARGIHLPSVARQFEQEDFDRFDYVLAMDTENYDNLLALSRAQESRKIVHLFRSFDSESQKGASVPDPYYGGAGGFDEVFDICEAACHGLLAHLQETQQVPR